MLTDEHNVLKQLCQANEHRKDMFGGRRLLSVYVDCNNDPQLVSNCPCCQERIMPESGCKMN